MVDAYEKTGEPERRDPLLRDGQLSFFAAKGASDATALFKAHFGALKPGGYAALLAYIERNESHERLLTSIRTQVRDATRAATVVGFGPRFLHSTGQAYKGGPAGGVFLEITRTADPDLAIPDHRATFGVVQVAQAMGDLDVLAERGRAWLRVHIDGDVEAGLAAIGKLIGAALR
jgi:transaldolase/glucose-6-phosphate isomerase